MKNILLFTALCIYSFMGFSQDDEWHKALKKNTQAGYYKYFSKYPNSLYADSARLRHINDQYKLLHNSPYLDIRRIPYENWLLITMISDSSYAKLVTNLFLESDYSKNESDTVIFFYKAFLEKYPDSRRTNQIKNSIQQFETNAYNKILSENSIVSFKNHLKKYPESQYKNEIQKKIEFLEYEQAKAENTIDSYGNFLKKYPECAHLSEISLKIDTIAFQTAKSKKSIQACEDFLQNYPNSTFTDEIEYFSDMINDFQKAKDSRDINAYRLHVSKFPDSDFKSEIDLFELLNGKTSINKAVGVFNTYPNHPSRLIIWESFRKSYYLNDNFFKNDEAVKSIGEILLKEYKKEYEAVMKSLYLNSNMPASEIENAGIEFQEMRKSLSTISLKRPIDKVNYDVINVYSGFFSLCRYRQSESLVKSSFEDRFSGTFWASITVSNLSGFQDDSEFPFYGSKKEWSSMDPEIIKFKTACLDMLEYHTNSQTAKDFLTIFQYLEQNERNKLLKDRLSKLKKKAEIVISQMAIETPPTIK